MNKTKAMTLKQADQLLRLCDKLSWTQLLDLGAYLIACAYHRSKPTVGTQGKKL
jgi:hypothetical protein